MSLARKTARLNLESVAFFAWISMWAQENDWWCLVLIGTWTPVSCMNSQTAPLWIFSATSCVQVVQNWRIYNADTSQCISPFPAPRLWRQLQRQNVTPKGRDRGGAAWRRPIIHQESCFNNLQQLCTRTRGLVHDNVSSHTRGFVITSYFLLRFKDFHRAAVLSSLKLP